MLPIRLKQFCDRLTETHPLPQRQAGDRRELRVLGRQTAVLPVMADQQEVGAVLYRAEVPGVAQIVTPIERHPGAAHGSLHARRMRASTVTAQSRASR